MTPTEASPARSASAAQAPMAVASTPRTAAGRPIPILISRSCPLQPMGAFVTMASG
jgi:hypothetical protein